MKDFYNSLINRTVYNFGFDSTHEFASSMFHSQLLVVGLPLAMLSSIIELYFGLHAVTLIAFIVLITLELITGITASKVKGIPIVSRRFSRFGFKLGIWFCVFFILQAMKKQYENSLVLNEIYSWLHSSIFIYVTFEYLLSVIENLSVITGENNNVILGMIKDKLGKYLKTKESVTDEFFQSDEELLTIISNDGVFKKVNDSWHSVLGYTEKEMVGKHVKKFLHPDDLEPTKNEFQNLKSTGVSKGFINRYRTKSGDYVYLQWDSKGGKTGLYFCKAKAVHF